MRARLLVIVTICMTASVSAAEAQAPPTRPSAPVTGGQSAALPGQGVTTNPYLMSAPPTTGGVEPAVAYEQARSAGVQPAIDPAVRQVSQFLHYQPDPVEVPEVPEAPPIPKSWTVSCWDPAPRLEAKAEAVFLQPNMKQSVSLATQYPFGEQQVRTTLNQPYITGARIIGEYHFGIPWSIDSTFFLLLGPDREGIPLGTPDFAYFLSNNSGLGPGPLENLPPGFPQVADDMFMDWDLRNYSVDANILRHWTPLKTYINDVVLGLGVRWYQLDETVTVTYVDQLADNQGALRAQTENNMIGPQFVFKIRSQVVKRVRISWETKIAMLANIVDDRTQVVGASVNEYSRTQFSALFEGNATAELFITKWLTAYGGFQMLYLDRVDRASGQFADDVDVFLSDHKAIDFLWMFGPRAGFAITF
ncbi:hypothetical protein [Planctomycetes bacterium Pan216]|uniref:hypothetical protein n=1 Tax=Kolteria novifilia TaxID=2527975 RepID=UPI0011A2AB10